MGLEYVPTFGRLNFMVNVGKYSSPMGASWFVLEVHQQELDI